MACKRAVMVSFKTNRSTATRFVVVVPALRDGGAVDHKSLLDSGLRFSLRKRRSAIIDGWACYNALSPDSYITVLT